MTVEPTPESPSLQRLPTPQQVRAELQAVIDRAAMLRQLLRFVERVDRTTTIRGEVARTS